MSQQLVAPSALAIPEPPPYLRELVAYLRREQAPLWEWFSSHRYQAEAAERAKLELLKGTYRLEAASHPEVHALAERVMAELGIAAPLTIYQAEGAPRPNAFLVYLPGEVHLGINGPVLSLLSPLELTAMLGHELAHYLLFTGWAGELLVARQIVAALAADDAAQPCHAETERLLSLHAEVWADRIGYLVARSLPAAVAMLVKLATGVAEVDPESYLRQAEEIFAKESATARELTHPESFIRARALSLWSRQGAAAEAEIERMLQGPPVLEQLCLLGQRRMQALVRLLLDAMLAPAFLRSEPLVGHARLFFPDYEAPASGAAAEAEGLAAEVAAIADKPLRDFLAYVLLDFAVADPALEDVPLAAALGIAERLGLGERFAEIARRELKLTRKQLDRQRTEAAATLAAAAAQHQAEASG